MINAVVASCSIILIFNSKLQKLWWYLIFFPLFLKNVVVIVCGCGYITEALSPRPISCKGQ